MGECEECRICWRRHGGDASLWTGVVVVMVVVDDRARGARQRATEDDSAEAEATGRVRPLIDELPRTIRCAIGFCSEIFARRNRSWKTDRSRQRG